MLAGETPEEEGGTPAPLLGLLDGDAFGEVAGFVDVAASEDGDVVGEELQRDDGQQGEEGHRR